MIDPDTALQHLSDDARLVWDTLQEQRQALDAIGISSFTRLPLERVLSAVDELLKADLVHQVAPEPVHQRVASAAVA